MAFEYPINSLIHLRVSPFQWRSETCSSSTNLSSTVRFQMKATKCAGALICATISLVSLPDVVPFLDSLPAAVLIPRACCAIPPRRRPGSRSIQPLEFDPSGVRLTVAYEHMVPGVRTSLECEDTDRGV